MTKVIILTTLLFLFPRVSISGRESLKLMRQQLIEEIRKARKGRGKNSRLNRVNLNTLQSSFKRDILKRSTRPKSGYETDNWVKGSEGKGDRVISLVEGAGSGSLNAQIKLAQMYEDGDGVPKDMVKALKYYTLAAQQRDLISMIYLADNYFLGPNGVKKDYKKARYWWNMAVEEGNINSAYNLAVLCTKGLGGKTDYKKAFILFEKAAKAKHLYAYGNLGNRYFYGQGTGRSHKKAVYWYEKGAKAGDALAQYSLGYMYYKGLGVKKKLINAYSWGYAAYKNGNKTAALLLRSLKKRLSRRNRRQAVKKAQVYILKSEEELSRLSKSKEVAEKKGSHSTSSN